MRRRARRAQGSRHDERRGAAVVLLGGITGLGSALRSVIARNARVAGGSRRATRSSAAARRSRPSASAPLELATERTHGVFGQFANQQFQSHSETFLKLARESLSVQNERAKGDLAAREQAIDTLVRPIREALERAERQMQELDKIAPRDARQHQRAARGARDEPTAAQRRDAQPRQRAAPARSSRPVGRDHVAPARRARRAWSSTATS